MRRGEVEVRDHRGNRRSEGGRGKGEGRSEKVRGGEVGDQRGKWIK